MGISFHYETYAIHTDCACHQNLTLCYGVPALGSTFHTSPVDGGVNMPEV